MSIVVAARNTCTLGSLGVRSFLCASGVSSSARHGAFGIRLSAMTVGTPQHVRGKKTVAAARGTPAHPGYDMREALKLSKCMAWAKFDETLEIAINTCVDPKKPNQMIRGLAQLPHGTGKSVRVAVFAKDTKAQEARDAGADIVGGQDLVDMILAGNIDFSRCIATPDMMALVGKVARVLGPKGLMPNPKVGSVTNNVAEAVKAAKQGEIPFKCDKYGVVRVPVGKLSFSDDNLDANITSFINHLNEAKPSGAKGTLIRTAHISSTMGKGIKLDMSKHPFKKLKKAEMAAAAAVTTEQATAATV